MLENLGVYRGFGAELEMHRRVIWALLMRELSTRYGRHNIGFLWLIGEPLIFAGAVTLMWSRIKPEFEFGIRVVPFTVTGYMCIILSRHMINHGTNCVKANVGLLYHRNITILHLFISRLLLEFVGVTFAALVIFSFLLLIGQMPLPKNLPMLYAGWAILGWMSVGLALIFGALSEIFEFMERIVGLITYVMVPLSGTFFMAAWVPESFRRVLLILPFIHPVEMVRAGFFGEFIRTYYSLPYAVAWAASLTFLGLVLVRFVRSRVEIE